MASSVCLLDQSLLLWFEREGGAGLTGQRAWTALKMVPSASCSSSWFLHQTHS